MMELGFNLVGDSGKENTDNVLARLDSFHTVKYQKKAFQQIELLKYF